MRAVLSWSLAAGLFFCLPFSQLGWWWSIPALACHALASHGSMRWWKRLAAGWIGWLPCWIVLEGWLHQVTTAGCIALIAYMAMWSALVPVVAARVRASLSARASWCGFPLALVGIEWARSRPIWDGYAWFQTGHAWIDATLPAQAADLLGVGLISLMLAVTGEAIACAWASRGSAATPFTRSWRMPAAVSIALISAATAWGAYRIATTPDGARVRIVAIQTDVLTSNKIRWTPEQQVKDMQQALDLSARAVLDLRAVDASEAKVPTLIAWPETSVPGFGLDAPTVATVVRLQAWPGDRFVDPILDLSRVAGPVLVGSPAFDGLRDDGTRWAWDRQFNAAYFIDDGRVTDRYDKAYLTPFGERMPYISAWDWLEDQLLAFGASGMSFDLQAGDRPRNMAWPGTDLRIATPICFEDTVSHIVRRMVRDPSPAACIVNLSNDGWFGTSDAGRRHHDMMARWRCIECRLPMVRVANTGASSSIDSCGRVVDRLAPRSADTLIATPQLDGRDTLIMTVGDSLPAMSLVMMCLLAVPVQRRWLGLAAAIGLILLAGCSSAGESSAVSGAWSTRSLSVTPDPTMPSTVRAAEPAFAAPEGTGVRESALVILTSACAAEYPQFRSNAVEALALDPATLTKEAGALLADPNPAVRFSACMAVGRARLALFAPAVKPLVQDTNLAVRAGAIFALQRLGQHPDQTSLAGMSGAKDLTTRGIAIFVLGELGNPSAVPVLRDALQRPTDNTNPMRARIVDLQTAEALAKLGDRSQLDPVRAALLAPGEQAELMCLGAQILGNIKDQSSEAMLLGIVAARGRTERPAEVRLLAGEAAIKMGSARTPEILAMARMMLTSRMPMVRAQAATTLGTGGLASDTATIAPLLRDSNPLVQLAAAQAILRCTAQDSTSGTVAAD